MTKQWKRAGIGLSLFMGLVLLVGGCSQSGSPGGQTKDTGKDKTGQVTNTADKKDDDSKHSGWWCDEHGVPEAECSMCSAKVAKVFQGKADWCKEHERAKSQCFICDSKLKEKYVAQYRAKYGKEPPPPEANMPKDASKKEDK